MPKVLTKAELVCLLDVKTSVDQARIIRQRNKAALKAIDEFEKGGPDAVVIGIGCPHCLATRSMPDCGFKACDECSYGKASSDEGVLVVPGSAPCLGYSFGGLTNSMVWGDDGSMVELSATTLELDLGGRTKKEMTNLRTWLEGHVEWAAEVIKRAQRKRKK